MKALVTGASSGIGREIAKVLAERGYDLILTARRADRLRELADVLPVKVEVIPADLTDRSQVKALWELVRDQDIDVLVNNAGRGLFGPFDETDLNTELEMLEVNIVALHTLTKLFLPKMKARGRGHILNVASSAAFLPGPLLSSYYASKAYVLRLSEAVAEELRRAKSKVTISILCPGPVPTEFDQVADVRFSIPGTDSASVARLAVAGTLRGQLLILPGVRMKAVHFFQRFVPDPVLARLCWRVQRRKSGPAL